MKSKEDSNLKVLEFKAFNVTQSLKKAKKARSFEHVN